MGRGLVSVSLTEESGDLYLGLPNEKGHPKYKPDFSSPKMQRKIQDEISRRGLLIKAVQGRSLGPLKIFDFYSGFAQDAFLLACAGHVVTSCEKNEMISQVTKQAYEKQSETGWVSELEPQLTLLSGDSKEVIQTLSRFDVVYMDPMFEKLKTTAKSPLPMQIVQALTKHGPPLDFEADFFAAVQKTNKVVIKLPLKGPSLLSRKPSHQHFGKTIRFDVYVI